MLIRRHVTGEVSNLNYHIRCESPGVICRTRHWHRSMNWDAGVRPPPVTFCVCVTGLLFFSLCQAEVITVVDVTSIEIFVGYYLSKSGLLVSSYKLNHAVNSQHRYTGRCLIPPRAMICKIWSLNWFKSQTAAAMSWRCWGMFYCTVYSKLMLFYQIAPFPTKDHTYDGNG